MPSSYQGGVALHALPSPPIKEEWLCIDYPFLLSRRIGQSSFWNPWTIGTKLI